MTHDPQNDSLAQDSIGLDDLDGFLITHCLGQRVPRQADLAGESAAMQRLAAALSDRPSYALTSLVEEAVALLGLVGRGSAGVSLLETDAEHGVEYFRRAIVCGPLAYRTGGVSPRGPSPCGLCIDRGEPVLMSRPEERFPEAYRKEVPLFETLLLPFQVRGAPGGVFWIATHDPGRTFDLEDVRVMTGLAAFAGAVCATLASLTEAEEASRAKNDFLALISHDLRTPLNAIGGYTSLLEMRLSGGLTQLQLEYVEGIHANFRRLTALVDDLLTLTVIEAGSGTAPEVAVDELLRDLQESFLPLLRAHELTLTVEANGHAPLRVRAERNKLNQILSTLISNAIAFTPSGGSIVLSSQLEGDRVGIRVRDTGVGIPVEDQAIIFEPFVQLQGEGVAPSGSGLGLTISRKLAQSMGGEITVQSTPGRGASFTVTLPAG